MSKQEWEFNGTIDCVLCKFRDFGCRADEKHCPYLAGWDDGQEKLYCSLRELKDTKV